MFKITYLWSKFCKKLPLSAIKNSRFEKPSKAEARSTVINSKMGRYSYCGYNCTIINAEIGRFTSIGDNVVIGAANHPLEWISTSPAFYYGKDSIPKNLAKLSYDASPAKTRIGNDVWIGRDVLVRGGVVIGNGACVGMGAVVTKDVPPYAIVCGNPARVIRYRFSDDVIHRLEKICWWNYSLKKIDGLANFADNVEEFIKKAEDSG